MKKKDRLVEAKFVIHCREIEKSYRDEIQLRDKCCYEAVPMFKLMDTQDSCLYSLSELIPFKKGRKYRIRVEEV